MNKLKGMERLLFVAALVVWGLGFCAVCSLLITFDKMSQVDMKAPLILAFFGMAFAAGMLLKDFRKRAMGFGAPILSMLQVVFTNGVVVWSADHVSAPTTELLGLLMLVPIVGSIIIGTAMFFTARLFDFVVEGFRSQ